jgi:hypothetical protein
MKQTKPEPGASAMARRLRWAASFVLAIVPSVAVAEVEWRPAVSGGYSKIFDGHAAFGAALRVQLTRFFFVQPEYLLLSAPDHTDYGPAVLLGFSGRSRDSLRPFVGLGGGPVKGYAGDDGLVYLALGASHPVARRQRVFVQAEIRYGLLGETAYSQFTLGVGISR